MAESGEELICPICQSEYQDAVIIQCHHSFCRKCITRWIDHKKSLRRGTFPYPLCKAVNETRALQKSFHVEQMRALIDKTKKQDSSYPSCDDHPGESLKFYCCDCKESVCVDCIMVKRHQKHNLESVTDVAVQMHAEMKNILDEERRYMTHLEIKMEKVEDCISHIKKEERLSVENCYRRADELKSQIETLARVAVTDIKQNIKSEQQTLTDISRCIIEKLEKRTQYFKAVDKFCYANNANQLISNYNEMLKISRPNVETTEMSPLSLSRFDIDHRALFEESKFNLTEVLDADLLFGKVSARKGESYSNLLRHDKQYSSSKETVYQVPDEGDSDESWNEQDSLSTEESDLPSRKSNMNSSFRSLKKLGKRKGNSVMDLRLPSMKDKLKGLFSKPFKKKY